jgi:hypothetical protein
MQPVVAGMRAARAAFSNRASLSLAAWGSVLYSVDSANRAAEGPTSMAGLIT